MREIKFRAWDNYSMLLWEWLDTSLNCVWTAINAQQYDNPEPILMQYTGLKDRNGKEIYEGDIIKEDYYLIVSWRNLESCWGFTNGDVFSDFYMNGTEVIGNIYENPELLEGDV